MFKNIEIPSSKQHKTLVSFKTPPLRSSDKALLKSAMITLQRGLLNPQCCSAPSESENSENNCNRYTRIISKLGFLIF